jgi:uncharacterized protein YukE
MDVERAHGDQGDDMGDTELEIGAQTRAAGYLIDAMDPVDRTIKDLAAAVEGAAGGFRGASSTALGEALTAWFTAAQELTPTLSAYAGKLVQVDVSEAEADRRAQDAFGRISGRLMPR